jgi:hypothetical protein
VDETDLPHPVEQVGREIRRFLGDTSGELFGDPLPCQGEWRADLPDDGSEAGGVADLELAEGSRASRES